MSRKAKALCAVAGVLVIVGLAYATTGFTFPWLSNDVTYTITHDFGDPNQPPGPLTTLNLNRATGLTPGTMDVDFTLEIQSVGVLMSAVLQTADDTNGDLICTPNEWTTVSTAIITELANKTVAVAPVVNLSESHDGYRVMYTRSDSGTTTETWGNNPLVDVEPWP